MKLFVTLLLPIAASAFSAYSPQSSVASSVIRSKWTMMPDEPQPEVCERKSLLLLLCIVQIFQSLTYSIRYSISYSTISFLDRSIPAARTPMTSLHQIRCACP